MAIQLVGRQTYVRTNIGATESLAFNLSGGVASAPAPGDVVILAVVDLSSTTVQASVPICPDDYNNYRQTYWLPYTSNQGSLLAAYKVMPTPADTRILLPANTSGISQAVAVIVLRGVDTATPLDLLTDTAFATATARADPPAITPVMPGSTVFAFCAGFAFNASSPVARPPLLSIASGGDSISFAASNACLDVERLPGWSSGVVDFPKSTTGRNTANSFYLAFCCVAAPATVVDADVVESTIAADSADAANIVASDAAEIAAAEVTEVGAVSLSPVAVMELASPSDAPDGDTDRRSIAENVNNWRDTAWPAVAWGDAGVRDLVEAQYFLNGVRADSLAALAISAASVVARGARADAAAAKDRPVASSKLHALRSDLAAAHDQVTRGVATHAGTADRGAADDERAARFVAHAGSAAAAHATEARAAKKTTAATRADALAPGGTRMAAAVLQAARADASAADAAMAARWVTLAQAHDAAAAGDAAVGHSVVSRAVAELAAAAVAPRATALGNAALLEATTAVDVRVPQRMAAAARADALAAHDAILVHRTAVSSAVASMSATSATGAALAAVAHSGSVVSAQAAQAAIGRLVAARFDTTASADVVACQIPQFARPIADDVTGGWVPSAAGATLASMLEEAVPDDASYIHTAVPDLCRMSLAPVSEPTYGGPIRMRYRLLPGTGSIIVRLKQGGTVVAARTRPLTAHVQEFADVLATIEREAIEDYGALAVEFESVEAGES